MARGKDNGGIIVEIDVLLTKFLNGDTFYLDERSEDYFDTKIFGNKWCNTTTYCWWVGVEKLKSFLPSCLCQKCYCFMRLLMLVLHMLKYLQVMPAVRFQGCKGTKKMGHTTFFS